jgi:hypothetical protein
MTPMPTQRLLLPQRQPRVPRPGPHPLVPFARGGGWGWWGARVAGHASRAGARARHRRDRPRQRPSGRLGHRDRRPGPPH